MLSKLSSLLHRFHKKTWPYSIMFLVSLIPFVTYLDSFQYQYIGSGDFISPINIIQSIYKRFFVFNSLIDYGQPIAYQIAGFFPGNVFYLILLKIGFSSLIVTLFYLSIIIFFTQFCFYQFLKYIFEKKLLIKDVDSRIILSAAIIFGISPHIVSLIPPGHFVQLTFYALLPYLLKLYDEDINRNEISFYNVPKYFVIFLFSIGAFANIGIIYSLILTIFTYSILTCLFNMTKILRIIIFFVIILILITLSSSFWLVPYMKEFSSLNRPDKSSMSLTSEKYLHIAVQSASIPNLFLGRGENQLFLLKNQAYVNPIPLLIFFYFCCFFTYGIFRYRKSRFVILLLILTIIALFITKGPHPPLPEPFLWLYRNFFGFQVFRRPVSKYYFIFMMYYFILIYIGIIDLNKRLNPEFRLIFIKLPIALAVIYFIIAFTLTKELTPFNIPNTYNIALEDLKNKQTNNIFMLPGIYSMQPSYNESLNNLYATDFLQFYWPFPLVRSDLEFEHISNQPTRLNSELINAIRKNLSFCHISKKLGMTHFMLRQNLSNNNWFEDDPEKLFSILKNHVDISSYKTYKDQKKITFTIFKLKNNCSSQPITTNNDRVSLTFNKINPVTYLVQLKNLNTSIKLELKLLSDPYWKIYSYPSRQQIPFISSTRSNNGDGFNAWEIDPKKIKTQLQNNTYSINSDQSININLLIYYSYQDRLHYGLVIFAISCVTIFFLFFYYYSKRK